MARKKKKKAWNFDEQFYDVHHPFKFRYIKSSIAWSERIAAVYGKRAAGNFVLGSTLLLKDVNQALQTLASMPKGTHIGMSSCPFKEMLPPQFLMEYNYEFIYGFKCVLLKIRQDAHTGRPLFAQTILEELVYSLIFIYHRDFIAAYDMDAEVYSFEPDFQEETDPDDWYFDLLLDKDLLEVLYDYHQIPYEHAYHFENWNIVRYEGRPSSSIPQKYEISAKEYFYSTQPFSQRRISYEYENIFDYEKEPVIENDDLPF
jgi:hypothetical protein